MLTVAGRPWHGTCNLSGHRCTVCHQVRRNLIDATPANRRVGDDSPTAVDFHFRGLELRLHEHEQFAAVTHCRNETRQHRAQGDERQVGDNEIKLPAQRAARHHRTDITGIHTVAHLDPRVAGNPWMQQPVSHIARHHTSRTRLQQTIDEATGRCTGVKYASTRNRERARLLREVLERCLKFQTTAAHILGERYDSQLISLGHLTSHVQHRRTIHGDAVVGDELRGLARMARQPVSDERLIDASRPSHASGAEHEVSELSEVVEYAIGGDSAIIG